MSTWIILAVTIGGFIACYRVAYRFFDEDEDDSVIGDGMDKAFPVIMALLVSTVWPFVLIGWFVWLIATPTTARQRRQQIHELEARQRQLQQEIADAERNLGIGRDHL